MATQLNQQTWGTPFLVIVVDRSELQNYLSVTEVDLLSDEDMQAIALAMKEELEELNFWEFMAFVARCKLAEKNK